MKNYLPWIGYHGEDKTVNHADLARGIERAGYHLIRTEGIDAGIDVLSKRVYGNVILSDILRDQPNVGFTMDSLAAIRGLAGYDNTKIIIPHLLIDEDAKLLRGRDIYLVDVYNPKAALEEILGTLREKPARVTSPSL